jgi:transcriptional regulator with XRE-family HTH domain
LKISHNAVIKDINVEIGKKIKMALIEKGKTQNELAEYMGRTRANVSLLIKGKRQIKLEDLAIISKYLNLPIEHFITPF